MAAIVKVEHIDDGYDVVLQDDEELVLAHYDTGDCDVCAGLHDPDQHARQDAERYASEVRRLLHARLRPAVRRGAATPPAGS